MNNENSTKYGLSGRAHGNYFDWKNQSFHTWCHFHLGKDVARYRESYITYLHYKDNGEMVTDTKYLDAHFATGVGQYNARWDTIEAEWYMAAEGCRKADLGDEGFQVVFTTPGAFLCFPNIENLPADATLSLRVSSPNEAMLEVREDSADGMLLGRCSIAATGGLDQFKDVMCTLKNSAGKKNLCLVFSNAGNTSVLSLDRYSFSAE